MKVNDIGTELLFVVLDQDGNPVNLETASRVVLVTSLRGERAEKDCEIMDAAAGQIRYIIQENDLPVAGTLNMEIRVEFIDGDVFTSNRLVEIIEPCL